LSDKLKIMAKQIKTSITINASKESVWKILMDFENYPEWNSFIKSVSGDVKVGNQIQTCRIDLE